MVAQGVVARRAVDRGAVARAGQGVHHHLRDPRVRAVGHQQDAVGEQDRLIHVVRDHERGLPRVRHQAQHLVLQGAAGQRVERAERLVHEQQLRPDGERAGDADALLHAARQLRRLAVGRVAEAHEVEHAARVLGHLGARPGAVARAHGEGDVAERGEPRQQRVRLEDHGAVERRAGDLAPVHDDGAGIGRFQPGEDVEDGGLAAAGVADEHDELAPLHAEPHVAEHGPVAVAPGDALDAQPGPAHRRRSSMAHSRHAIARAARPSRASSAMPTRPITRIATMMSAMLRLFHWFQTK